MFTLQPAGAIFDPTGTLNLPQRGWAGSWSDHTVGDSPRAVEVSDLNLDGIQDRYIVNANSNDVSVLFGNGDGTFHPQQSFAFAHGTSRQSIALADFNGDGIPDRVLY